MASIVGFLLVVFFALVALAVDIGYIMLTQTELQAASDAATLGGGTELLPGLGRFATKTPAEVEAAARPVAVEYAAANEAGDLSSAYADPQRDVAFGHAIFDPDTGAWQRTYLTDSTSPRNMITVTLHRDQEDSTNGDAPLPLFFAQLLGIVDQNVAVDATAVIMPVKGFTVTPGSNETANIIPFAFRQSAWDRLMDAQSWYYRPPADPNGAQQRRTIPQLESGQSWEYLREYTFNPDYENAYGVAENGEHALLPIEGTDYYMPMFHSQASDPQGNPAFEDREETIPIFEPDIFDDLYATPNFTADSVEEVSSGPDGWLETNIYPRNFALITAGNAGTIDLGETNNSANVIGEQVTGGLTATDFAAMAEQDMLNEAGEFILDPTSVDVNGLPLTEVADGDTGISGGPIDHAFNEIIGKTRVMLLFSQVVDPGDNAIYTLTRFVGIRIMAADLTTGQKYIWVQPAPVVASGAIADIDDEIGDDTTVFTPLILIE